MREGVEVGELPTVEQHEESEWREWVVNEGKVEGDWVA